MRTLARIFPYLLLVPAVLPLVFVDGLLYPYLAPKTLLFRADFILAVAAFLALALSGHQFYFERVRHWHAWIPGALLLVAYITSALGVDFYHSFWSIYDRGDGLLSLTALVGFFYLFLVSADERLIARFTRLIAWVASAVALISVLQWIQQASGMNFPLIPSADGRIGGTMGNAAFLAGYLGIGFFVTLLAIPLVRGRQKTALMIGAALQIIAIILTATRGTFLALLVAGGVALIYVAWRGGVWRRYAQFGLLALVIVAGLFVTFRAHFSQSSFEPVRRLASISLRDVTVESRLFIWSHIGSEVSERPLTGVGAENIETLFNKIYDPTAIVEQWFDRTHNAFLDYLVQYGVFGLLLYLTLIAVFALESIRGLWKEGMGLNTGSLFSLLVIVYVVQNFFVFDTALTLWLFLTLFSILLIHRVPGVLSSPHLPKLPSLVPLAAGGIIATLIVPVSLIPLRANLLLAQGYLYHVFDARKAVNIMEKGYALGTYADMEYGYQLYEMYVERQATMLTGEARVVAYRFVESILSQNYARYSYDARTATYYAHVLDSSPPEITRSDERLREVIAHAIELSPKRIQPWYLLVNMSIRAGDALPKGNQDKNKHYEMAVSVLTEYSKLVPRLAEPRFVIATLYLTMGDRTLAKQWADEALPLYKTDLATARRAARYYVTIEDWVNSRRFLADVVSLSPTEFNIKYDLAKAEFMGGNVERAKQLVGELKIEAPGLVDTDPAFVKAVEK